MKTLPISMRIAVYDHNDALRESLYMLLSGRDQYTFVGAFSHCLNIEEEVRRLKPDVILMDIQLPGRCGIEGTYLAKQADPVVEVLIHTLFDDDEKVFGAVCAGAGGYLLKKTPPTKILEAIDEVYLGGAPMTPVIARKVLQFFPKTPAANTQLNKLSPREQTVLRSLATGNSYKMVAGELGVSLETVRTHVKRIYQKLHVHSVAEAISKAFLK